MLVMRGLLERGPAGTLGKDKAQACRPSPQDQGSRIFMDLPPSVGG